MKKIIGILAALMMCFTLSSCVTAAQAQVDGVYYDDNVDISVVVTYGIPYYNTEGLLLYYVYRDMYYYPYYYHNRYYLHRYHKPLPQSRLRVYKPVPRDFYRHEPPRRYQITPPNRSTQHMRPNINRGGNVNRPTTPRTPNRTTMGNRNGRHFGGSRR